MGLTSDQLGARREADGPEAATVEVRWGRELQQGWSKVVGHGGVEAEQRGVRSVVVAPCRHRSVSAHLGGSVGKLHLDRFARSRAVVGGRERGCNDVGAGEHVGPVEEDPSADDGATVGGESRDGRAQLVGAGRRHG